LIGIASKATTYALGAALLASLAWGGWQWRGKVSARQTLAEAQTARAAAEKALAIRDGEIASEREIFERQARAQEQRHAADMNRIEREHKEALTDAQAAADRLVSDLRNGNVRLRQQWQGCVAASGLSDAAGTAAGTDAAASDREQGAADIVRAARQCDIQVKGLQDVIRSDRKTTGDTP
jgi:hypothetical protein